ncbi:MAG: TolC family protein, partial [Candidatus Omnitrophota bacterium]
MMRNLAFLLIALCLRCVCAQAEEVVLTLPEAIAIALRDNRDVLLQAEELQKSKHALAESQAALWPALSLLAGETLTHGYYADKDLFQFSGQITLKQYLYKGGKTSAAIAQDEYQIEADQALLERTKLETALVVKKAFFTLLLAEEFARLNKNIVENAEKHLAKGEAKFSKGQAAELEILKLKE